MPFSGNVWKLIWLSASKATRVKPCGSNLYFVISNTVTFAIFAILYTNFSKKIVYTQDFDY